MEHMRTALVIQLRNIVFQCRTDLKNNGLTDHPVYSTLCDLTEKGDDWGHSMWHAPKSITEALHTIYGKKVVVLVDEYEAPLNDALTHGYLSEASEFFGRLFSVLLKVRNVVSDDPGLMFILCRATSICRGASWLGS